MRNDIPDRSVPNVVLLARMMLDGFKHVDLSTYAANKVDRGSVQDPGRILKEIIGRFIRQSTDSEFIDLSKELFRVSFSFDRAKDQLKGMIFKVERSGGMSSFSKRRIAEIADRKDLFIDAPFMMDAYCLGQSLETIKSSGNPLRDMYFEKNKSSLLASIPEIRKISEKMSYTNALFQDMSDKELCLRTIRLLSGIKGNLKDMEKPVYGTSTIIGYAPEMMERLFNPVLGRDRQDMENMMTRIKELTIEVKREASRIKVIFQAESESNLSL